MATATAAGIERAAALFRALGDPTRLGIVERLRDGERCVCELTDALDAAQSRLSFHLKTLKDAGILRDRRQGRWVYYALNDDVVDEVRALVDSMQGPRGGLRIGARRR